MRGLPIILSLFCDTLNKFNNTGARLLGSIYCMTLKLLLNHVKNCVELLGHWLDMVYLLPQGEFRRPYLS